MTASPLPLFYVIQKVNNSWVFLFCVQFNQLSRDMRELGSASVRHLSFAETILRNGSSKINYFWSIVLITD